MSELALREALKEAEQALFEAEDKFWVAHCNHPAPRPEKQGLAADHQRLDKAFLAEMSFKMKAARQRVKDALATPTEWQDIESAPRDASYILVARRHEQGVVFYRDGRWWLGAGTYFDRPTHWQPLPPAPPVRP